MAKSKAGTWKIKRETITVEKQSIVKNLHWVMGGGVAIQNKRLLKLSRWNRT